MSIPIFFINSPIDIPQNGSFNITNVSGAPSFYDYIISINASSLGSMNSLFNNRSYINNNIDLTINLNIINQLLYSINSSDISSTNNNITITESYQTLTTNTDRLFGSRVLEIIATKVFGSAKGHNVIKNLDSFYLPYSNPISLVKIITDGINIGLNSKKTDVYNTYIAYGRTIEDSNFNLSNTNWEFPVILSSTIDIPNSGNITNNFNNGPNIGGAVYKNGQVEIPILVRFHTTERNETYTGPTSLDDINLASYNSNYNVGPEKFSINLEPLISVRPTYGVTKINQTGDNNISGPATLSQSVTVYSSLYVSDKTQLNSNLTILSNLTVSGSTKIIGATNIYDNTIVKGETYINSRLNVSGDSNLNSTLSVSGATTMQGITNIIGKLNVSGSSNINSLLYISGLSNINGNVSVSSKLNVSGITNINSDLNVIGGGVINSATVISNLNISGLSTILSSLNVSGLTTINGNVSINSNLNILGSINILNDLVANGINVFGNTSINSNLFISGQSLFNNILSIPTLTNIEISSLTNLTKGQILINSSINKLTVYDGTVWQETDYFSDNTGRIHYGAFSNKQIGSIGLGYNAGQNNQGQYSIAIGANSGINNQTNKSIIINATGVELNSGYENSLYVDPIRTATASTIIYYDTTTKELTYSVGSGGVADATNTIYSFLNAPKNIIINGTTTILSDLYISGFSNFRNTTTTTISSNLYVSGNTAINSNFYSSGPAIFNSLILPTTFINLETSFNSSLFISGSATFNNLTINSSLLISGNTTFGNTLIVSGPTNINGSLNVIGPLRFNSGSFLSSLRTNSLLVSGSLTLGSTIFSNNLTPILVNPNFSGDSTIIGTTTVLGAYITGTTTINSSLNVSGNLSIMGKATLLSSLFINARANLDQVIFPVLTTDQILSSTNLSNGDITYNETEGIFNIYNNNNWINLGIINDKNISGRTVIGSYSGLTNQSIGAVSIGYQAGHINQGEYSIALGYRAAPLNQPNNSIVINANGNDFNVNNPNSLYITSIRNLVNNNVLYYDSDNKEILYRSYSSISGSSNIYDELGLGLMNVSNTSLLTGSVTCASNLVVTTPTYLTNVFTNDIRMIASNSALTNILNVSDNTVLNVNTTVISFLNVSGQTTIMNSATFNNTGGTTILNSYTSITSPLTIGANSISALSDVYGNINFNSNIVNISGNIIDETSTFTNINKSFNVSGNTTLQNVNLSTFSGLGARLYSNNTTSNSIFNFTNINAYNESTILSNLNTISPIYSQKLNISNVSIINGNTSINSTLSVSGITIFNDKIRLDPLTTAEINTTTSNLTGYTVFNSTTRQINIYNGSNWTNLEIDYDKNISGRVRFGNNAGLTNQGIGSIAIGNNAGNSTQANYAIAIGNNAGKNNQLNNSIIINASNSELSSAKSNGLYINPIRNATTNSMLYYDNNTGEITNGPIPDNLITLSSSSIYNLDVTSVSNLVGNISVNSTLNVSGSSIMNNIKLQTNNSYIQYKDNTKQYLKYEESIDTLTSTIDTQLNFAQINTTVDNNWSLIIWSPELSIFCAISSSLNGNAVAISSDGTTWITYNIPNNNWTSVTWSSTLGLFCAVASSGTGNRVMTSPDGIIWTTRSSVADNNWTSVTWGNYLFCAVASSGTGNRVMTSPDGIIWTTRSSAADNNWISITWSTKFLSFYILSNDGYIMKSLNGISWTTSSSFSGYICKSILSDSSGILILMNGIIQYTIDGTLWYTNQIYQAGYDFSNIIQLGNNSKSYLLLIKNEIRLMYFYYEIGSTSFTELIIKPNINLSNNLSYSMGLKNGYYSTELNKLICITIDNQFISFNLDIINNRITNNQYGGYNTRDITWASSLNKFLIVGPVNYLSTDGINLTGYTNYNNHFISVDWSSQSNFFCAIQNILDSSGNVSYTKICKSINGTSWTDIVPNFTYEYSYTYPNVTTKQYLFSKIRYANNFNLFFAISTARGSYSTLDYIYHKIIKSSDGITWSDAASYSYFRPSSEHGIFDIILSPNIIIVLGDLYYYISTNGINWSKYSNTLYINNLVWCSDFNAFYGVSSNFLAMSNLYKSIDGINFTLVYTDYQYSNLNVVSFSPIGLIVSIYNNTYASKSGIRIFNNDNDSYFYSVKSDLKRGIWSPALNTIMFIGTNIIYYLKYSTTQLSPVSLNLTNQNIIWVSRYSPNFIIDNDWQSVCWSPELGLFCAVASSGTNNRVMTSTDGITWITRTSPENNNWVSVCWSPQLGIFCAVAPSGNGNRAMTSLDGITWITRSTFDNGWCSVCWSPELTLFCAVSTFGTWNKVMTSPDGINWTTRTPVTNNSLYSVCWSPSLLLFCAVTATATMLRSSNGINWSSVNAPVANQWISICWSPERSLFCAVASSGTNNRVVTSPNGTTWTTRTTPVDYTWVSVCWAPGINLFCAISSSGIMTSSDGITWTSRANTVTNDWKSITWSPTLNILCVVGASGFDNRVMTSSNTTVWSVDPKNNWQSICWSPKLNLYCAISNHVMISYDGSTWRPIILYVNNNWVSITWSSTLNLFCAVANSGNGNRVMTSSDGITWITRTSAADNDWISITWGNNLFCAVASSGTNNRIMTSSDGIIWITQTSPIDNNWTSVTWGNNLFCAVASSGTGNRVMTSPDGITWSTQISAIDNNWTSITWGNNLFCAVANSGTGNRVMTSLDGITWITQNSAVDNNWTSIIWISQLNSFYAVANSGTYNRIMYSLNGNNWVTLYNPINNNWTSISWSPQLNLVCSVANTGANNRLMVYKYTSSSILVKSITWSSQLNIFCAISADTINNRLMTSMIGGNWNIITSPANNSWSSICWSPELSLFCVVADSGIGNRIMVSSNGTTWTTKSNPVDNNWVSVCWSKELTLFCAVASSGSGNRIMTSPNGNTWTTQSTPIDNNWSSVCWADTIGLFCAVATTGSGNRIMTSSDGIIWVSRTSPVDNEWTSVCWAKELSLLCAVSQTGSSNRVMISSNGIIWTTQITGDSNWSSIIWASELSSFCAVASSGTNKIMVSSNGINWIDKQISSNNNLLAITWSPQLGKFCAVSSTGDNRIVLSNEINEIFNLEYPLLSTSNVVNKIILAPNKNIQFDNKIIQKTAFTGSGRIFYNSSVNHYLIKTAPVGMNKIIWSSELKIFCAITTNATNRIAISSNGIVWNTEVPMSTLLTDIIWSPELELFCGISTNAITISSDGIIWNTSATIVTNTWTSITWSPELGIFCAVSSTGTNDRVMISTNGINWITQTSPNSNWIAVRWSSELLMFVAISNSTTTMYSYDGISWTTSSHTLGMSLSNMEYSPSIPAFIGYSNLFTSTVIRSIDGINWTTVTIGMISISIIWNPTLNNFTGFNVGNNTSVTRSNDGITWTSSTITFAHDSIGILSSNTWTTPCWSPELNILISNSFSNNALLVSTPSNDIYDDNISYVKNNVAIGKDINASFRLDLSRDTALSASTSWSTGSDRRVKKNIVDADIDRCYEINKNLKLKYFEWNDKYIKSEDKHSLGFIAQDVKQYFPKAVKILPEKFKVESGEEILEDYHCLDVDQLYKLMWGTNKKLIDKIESLENDVQITLNKINNI